jgi:hypothetical protein
MIHGRTALQGFDWLKTVLRIPMQRQACFHMAELTYPERINAWRTTLVSRNAAPGQLLFFLMAYSYCAALASLTSRKQDFAMMRRRLSCNHLALELTWNCTD